MSTTISIPAKCGNSSHVDHNFSNLWIHSTVVFEFPISLFAIYCILKITPMKSAMVRVLLLLHQIWYEKET
ncbi:hypothetical protein CRE_27252 [Caenorhabditis remanei]|uniref:Serpentine receptor class gamma n=1 Tax=Caenorhabditis remanei TaxID=31234 RepID=E3LPA6_CAERE|nr:hypothetical protein CRE_27252 [Caenorhabditis remanei]